MQKVVSNGLKIDLHIHSIVSSHKDGTKVKNNTLDNIPLLIKKLNDQNVNICSITDHDTFSYDFYVALKQAESEKNSIQKVLPGVEFSVCFFDGDRESVIHVVAIFSDEDEKKIQAIEELLRKNPPTYKLAYKEEDFLDLLRRININTILIAHQKNTLTSTKARKNDANTLGEFKFLEFVYTDYFEAFEFKNRRNEILNKAYLFQKHLENQIRFVTGTDCHDWSVYPSETPEGIISDFPYTYAKCLPTFKGLVMAVTDHTRLKTVNSFFTATKYTLPSISFKHDTDDVVIPLSKGINVIIGDNSVGKSLLLHAITGYTKPTYLLPNQVKAGYRKYLAQLGLDVPKQITPEHIFCFDMQGEVRTKFEENKLNATEFLGSYFPKSIDNSAYKAMLEIEIGRMIGYLEKKFKLDKKTEKLSTFGIETSAENAESITFVNSIGRAKKKTSQFSDLSLQIDHIITQMSALEKMEIDDDDRIYIQGVSAELSQMKEKYNTRVQLIEAENSRMETVSKIIRKYSEKHRRSITDAQKRRSEFTENVAELKNQIIDLINVSNSIETYVPFVEYTKIRTNSNQVYDYEFISKLEIEEINTQYFLSLISRTLKARKTINWMTITESELQDALLKYDNTPVLQFFSNALHTLIEADLRPKNSIIYQGMDKYAEMSSGLDAKIYFDLLSYEMQQDGIYIIDQPEDNISQNAIREYLLDRFKTMGENRQVIMVTHNPQFIVNLDVDNLIFLSKKNGLFSVQSGALEYVCPEYSVLDIVAQNIDGGLDSIKKRWKRYEKTTEL